MHNRKLVAARLQAQELTQQAQQSIEQKSQLLHVVSEQMREALTEVKQSSNNLQNTNTETHQASLSQLHSAVEKLKQLYSQILS